MNPRESSFRPSSERQRGPVSKTRVALSIATLGALGFAGESAVDSQISPVQAETARPLEAAQVRQAIEASPSIEGGDLIQPPDLAGLKGRILHNDVLTINADEVNIRDYPGTHDAEGRDSNVLDDIDGKITIYGTVSYGSDVNGEWLGTVLRDDDDQLRMAFFSEGAATEKGAVEVVSSGPDATISAVDVRQAGVLAQLADGQVVGVTTSPDA